MAHKTGCTVCGSDLVYSDRPRLSTCFICKNEVVTAVTCRKDHFICDACHSSDANELIFQFCENTHQSDPVAIARLLMNQPQVKMHGPEHHFLVPAVLLAAYYNHTGDEEMKKLKLYKAKFRAEKVPGGFCGSHGNCGAAVGVGIFVSLITGATPLSGKSWQLANRITGRTLLMIADKGGPRCCKRDSFTAIAEASKFIQEEFSVSLPLSEARCDFSSLNQQCLHAGCSFYQKN